MRGPGTGVNIIYSMVLACLLAPFGTVFAAVPQGAHQDPKTHAVTRPGSDASRREASSGVSQETHESAPAPVVQPETPRIVVNTPPAAPVEWPTHEKIAWAASLILTILCYAGLMFGRRMLEQMKYQTETLESLATAAQEAAHVALMTVEKQKRMERPWLLVSVSRTKQSADDFEVMVCNRGQSPAEVFQRNARIVLSEKLQKTSAQPDFVLDAAADKISSVILLPGESAWLFSFSRSDLSWICKTGERQMQVERGLLHLYFYGKVGYKGLTDSEDAQGYQTNWCCRYIHNEVKSTLQLERIPGITMYS